MIRVLTLAPLFLLGLAWQAHGQQTSPVPDVALEQHLNEQVPLDLVFRDETGASVPLGKYFGERPVILVLGYYRCPRLCSLVLNGLTDCLKRIDYDIGRQYAIVTVSIDPRETSELAAAKKATYLAHYNRPCAAANAGWHFLTGDEPAIKRLADTVGFRYQYDAKHDQYAHASGIMVLTPGGMISRYFYGIEYSPRDVRFGLEDASVGKVGSPIAHPLRMLCFAYDPASGTYTLMTLRLVRLGGVLTILVLGIFLARAWWRERRLVAKSLKEAG